MKLTIDGKDYEFSVEAAKSAGILKEVLPRQTIKIGSYYIDTLYNYYCVIVSVGNSVVLMVKINSGVRVTSFPVKVRDIHDITDDEFAIISGFEPTRYRRCEIKISELT